MANVRLLEIDVRRPFTDDGSGVRPHVAAFFAGIGLVAIRLGSMTLRICTCQPRIMKDGPFIAEEQRPDPRGGRSPRWKVDTT